MKLGSSRNARAWARCRSRLWLLGFLLLSVANAMVAIHAHPHTRGVQGGAPTLTAHVPAGDRPAPRLTAECPLCRVLAGTLALSVGRSFQLREDRLPRPLAVPEVGLAHALRD